MANYTTNHNLYKWDKADTKLETITEQSANADKLDAKLTQLDTDIASVNTSASDALTTANEAKTESSSALTNSNDALTSANNAETIANNAASTATNAETVANTANTKSDDTQQQLNTIIINNGESDAEVLQARGGYSVLNDRLNGTDAQLAEKAKQEEVTQLSKQLVPKRYIFGEQLERLKYALSNPLEQYMSVVFLGDSITWGLLATGNPTDYNTGRDGTLSDIRDKYISKSWVNNIKRYIGSKYMFNASPVLSNWSASPSGESSVEFNRQITLFPYDGDFTVSKSGTVSSSPTVITSTSSLSGTQLYVNVGNAQDGVMTIEFPFTGKEFTLSFDCVVNSMDYELFVDGVSQGTFSTAQGVDGITYGYDRRRTHTFPYVKNKAVQIKSKLNGYSGTQTLKIGGIIINKTIKISNQGIIGTTARLYKQRNLEGNTSGDGTALSAEDKYVFVQLGTNDRLIVSGVPKGVNAFKSDYVALIDSISAGRDLVLMCANPAANESPTSYSFNMQDVRNAVYRVAKDKSMDFIDNYSIFGDIATTEYLADGLHPNDVGHEVYSRNIINSLEFN